MEITQPLNRSREQAARTAFGYTGENANRYTANSPSITIDGTVYFMSLGLLAGDVVSNILVEVTAAGSGVTANKVGIYNSGSSLVASSADLGSAWQSAGIKSNALSSAYTVPSDGVYYLAVFAKASTTLPTLMRAGTGGSSTQLANGLPLYALQTGQTDLPSSATMSRTSAISFWVGWS